MQYSGVLDHDNDDNDYDYYMLQEFEVLFLNCLKVFVLESFEYLVFKKAGLF